MKGRIGRDEARFRERWDRLAAGKDTDMTDMERRDAMKMVSGVAGVLAVGAMTALLGEQAAQAIVVQFDTNGVDGALRYSTDGTTWREVLDCASNGQVIIGAKSSGQARHVRTLNGVNSGPPNFTPLNPQNPETMLTNDNSGSLLIASWPGVQKFCVPVGKGAGYFIGVFYTFRIGNINTELQVLPADNNTDVIHFRDEFGFAQQTQPNGGIKCVLPSSGVGRQLGDEITLFADGLGNWWSTGVVGAWAVI